MYYLYYHINDNEWIPEIGLTQLNIIVNVLPLLLVIILSKGQFFCIIYNLEAICYAD